MADQRSTPTPSPRNRSPPRGSPDRRKSKVHQLADHGKNAYIGHSQIADEVASVTGA